MNMTTNNPAEWKLINKLVELCKSDSLSFELLQESTNFIPRRTAKAGLIFGSTKLIHLVFTHPNVTKEMVELLLDLNPDAAGFYSEIKGWPSFSQRGTNGADIELGRNWSLPLHDACKNVNFPASAIQTLVKMYPTALAHRAAYSVLRTGIPLEIYLSRESNIDIDAVRVLVDTVPEDVMTECVHKFVRHKKIGQHLDVVKFLIVQQQLPIHEDLPLLHAALFNESGCPSDIILFLAETFPFALTHLYSGSMSSHDDEGLPSLVGFENATPLEIYLRSWKHIDYTVAEALLAPLTNTMIADSLFAFFWCGNVGSHLDIVKMLIERNPSAVEATYANEASLLHKGCRNDSMTLQVAKFLVEKRNGFTHQLDSQDSLPLHSLCMNSNIDETASLEILNFLVEMNPESVRHSIGDSGFLAIHCAAAYKSPSFCEALIKAYPDSISLIDEDNSPFYLACAFGTQKTVEYFYSLAPHRIEVARSDAPTRSSPSVQ
ncbi:hypothetical protein ACHAWC_011897 [Mediolabrus comicus]